MAAKDVQVQPEAGETFLPSGFELRLADGRALISVSGRPLIDGVVVRRFRMEVPRIKFPFDVTGGADRFRDERCLLRELELSIEAPVMVGWIAAAVDLDGLVENAAQSARGSAPPLELAARPGFLEISGRHPSAGSFTAKLAVELAELAPEQGEPSPLALFLYDLRLYQPSTVSAAEILHAFARRAKPPLSPGPLPGQLTIDPLTPALRQLLVPRGFRLPEMRGVGLRRAHVLTGQLVLEFEERELPANPPSTAELLAREGQRAFSEVERALAAGNLEAARGALRDLSQVEAHPFAAERLLQLSAADPAWHDLALDLCALLRKRSPVPPVALWVEAVIREELGGAEGESAGESELRRAAQTFLELAEVALAERALFAAALAARRAAELARRAADDNLATRAFALWESAVPNAVEALLGLAEIAERRGDLATALGALRRVSAFSRDGQVSAAAHARLGRLLLEKTDDVARARLHLDQALRQNPDDLVSLLALARSCERGGEWVREVRLLDRAAAVAHRQGDRLQAAELLARAGGRWEMELARPENALLRYRQALAEEPPDAVRTRILGAVSRVSQALGLRSDALEAQRALVRASAPGRPRAETLTAEARLLSEDPLSRGLAERASLAALREDPAYFPAARLLIELRRAGFAEATASAAPPDSGPLREALGLAASLAPPAERLELLLARGDLELAAEAAAESDFAGPLAGSPVVARGTARASFAAALALAPDHLPALERLIAAAEAEGDLAGVALTTLALAARTADREARVGLLRRAAAAALRLADPQAGLSALRAVAAVDEAPLPVLQALLSRLRASGAEPAETGPWALRLAEGAIAGGTPDLAVDALLEELATVQSAEGVDPARPVLERAVTLAPRNGLVRSEAVRLYRLAGDLDALRPALEALLQTSEAEALPRQLAIWHELAEVSLGLGARHQALASYEAIHALDPDDRSAAEALVDMYALEGRAEEQVHALVELAVLLERQAHRREAASRLVELAGLRFDAVAALGALAMGSAAPPPAHPASAGSPAERAQALVELQRAASLDPREDVLRPLAEVAEALGRGDLASSALAQLAGLLPTARAQAEAWRRAAWLAVDEAGQAALAGRAAAADPDFPWGQVWGAGAALAGGAFAEALQLAEAALAEAKLAEDEPAGYAAHPVSLSDAERTFAEATAWAAAGLLGDGPAEDRALARLAARDPQELAYPRRRLAVWRALTKSTAAAALAPEEVQRLLFSLRDRLPPAEVLPALVDLGAAWARRGDATAAAEAWAAALALDPADPGALLGLFSVQGEAAPAEVRQRLLRLPASQTGLTPVARGRLLVAEARAQETLGNAGEALKLWTEALGLLPQSADPPRALARLAQAAEAESGGDDQARSAAAARGAGYLEELARRLPRGDPERGTALAGAVEALRRSGQANAAAELANQVLLSGDELTPDLERDLWRLLASLRRAAADQPGELAALAALIRRSPGAEQLPLWHRRAELLRGAGDREGERLALTQALRLAQSLGAEGAALVPTLEALRSAASDLDDPEGEAEALERLLAVQAQQGAVVEAAAAAFDLAQLASGRLGQPARAEVALRRSLALAPDHRPARAALVELLIARSQPEALDRALELAAAGLPFLGEPSAQIAAKLALAERAARKLDRPDVALRLLRQLWGGPEVPFSALALGADLLYRQGATAEALAWLDAAAAAAGDGGQLAGGPSESGGEDGGDGAVSFGVRRAELLLDSDRPAEAWAALSALLGQPPLSAGALDLVLRLPPGVVAPRALADLAGLVAADGRAAALLSLAAAGSSAAGDERGALDFLREAERRSPDPQRRADLAKALEAAGDWPGLRALLAQQIAAAEAAGEVGLAQAGQRQLAEVAARIGDPTEEARAWTAALAGSAKAGLAEAVAVATTATPDPDGNPPGPVEDWRSAAFLRLGQLHLGELPQRDPAAALAAFAAAAELGSEEALDRAQPLARALGDAARLAALLERRLAGGGLSEPAPRAAVFGELAALYRGPLAAPELADRTLRRALAAGATPQDGIGPLVELLRREGRATEVADLLLRQAALQRERGELVEAAATFSDASAELVAAEVFPAAVAAARAAVACDPVAARRLALADVLYAAGEEPEAAAIYGEVIDGEPLPPLSALERRASFLRRGAERGGLVALLERHAAALPRPAEWLLEAAALRREAGEAQAEVADLRAALAAAPELAGPFAALIARGGLDAADRWLELLRRRAAAVPAEAQALLRAGGELLQQEGRLAEAAATYDEALALAGDPRTLAARLEVAAAQQQPLGPWAGRLLSSLSGEAGGVGAPLSAEVVLRAGEALWVGGEVAAARTLVDWATTAGGLSPLEGDSLGWWSLRDRLAAASGDRAVQIQARRAKLRTALRPAAPPAERGAAIDSLLDVLVPGDPQDVALLADLWQAQGTPHSARLADRRRAALAAEPAGEPGGGPGSQPADEPANGAGHRQTALAAFLEELIDAPLVPAADPAQRWEWVVEAAAQRATHGPPAAQRALFGRALALAEVQADPLAALRRLGNLPLLPADRLTWLGTLAPRVAPPERGALLLERARRAEAEMPSEAASAWQAVLGEGPESPGYLQALERTLQRALQEERYADAAAALIAQAEVIEGGQARAQLLEKAAQIRELRLADLPGAVELYRRAAAESGDVRWFTLLAEAYDRAGRPAEAAAALAVEVARREPGERRRERQRKLGILLARELGRPAEALPHLRAVVAGDETAGEPPQGVDDPAVLEALAEAAAAVGDAESELLALDRLPRRADPATAEARTLRRAQLLAGQGRSAEAAELWATLLLANPGNREAFGRLGQQLRERKAWRELADTLARHQAALEPGVGLAERLALLAERAEIHDRELAEPLEAERLYREILSLSALGPIAAAALEALRRLVDSRGDQGALVALLEAQLAATADDAQLAGLALQLGQLQLRLGDPAAAGAALRRAEASASRGAPQLLAAVRAPLAQVELTLGDWRAALDLAEQGLAAAPAASESSVELARLAGKAALAGGQRLRALGHFRDILQQRASDPEALAGLEALATGAEVGEGEGVAAEALAQRIAHEDDPARKARALRALADLRERARDPMGAEAALREAVRLDPDGEEGFARLRQLLEAEGRHADLAEVLRERARGTTDEVVRAASLAEQGDLLRTQLHEPIRAAEAYQRSLEILPRASTSEGYAEALFALGRDELAAEHYRRALAGGGHLGEFFLLFRLGEIARRSGDKALALDHYRRAVAANPSFLPAREALVELAEELGRGEVALEALRGLIQQLDAGEFGEQLAEAQLKIAEIEKRALRFEAAGEALERAAELRPSDRRPLERLAALYQNGARWPEAVRVLERLAALSEPGAAAVALTAAGEISYDKLAEMERAAELFAQALSRAPAQEAALRRSLEIAASLGQTEKLLSLADPLLAPYVGPGRAPPRPPPSWLEELLLPLAEAYEKRGRLEEAQAALRLARRRAPEDLELLQRQATLAKRSGNFGDEVALEEQLVEKITSQRPLEAATRLRALARRLLQETDDADQARRLLERAAELAPARAEDRRLLADLWRQTGDPSLQARALEAYLEIVRRDPVLDLVLLRVLAATAEGHDRSELAQVASSLVAALEGAPAGPAPSLTPLPQSAWALGSLAAEGGLDLVLQTLAPYLEPLFPVQLGRFAIGPGDRVGPGHLPELHQWVERVRESLGARPTDVYLAQGLLGVTIENSSPPSLVVGAPAVAALGQAGIQYLLCQRLALAELGFTLPSKFSPKDVTTLAALVTLFLNAEAPVPASDRGRLQAFLEALQRTCPEAVRSGLLDQAARAARELPAFDPHRYRAAAAARAHRLALLVTGDLRAALAVFALGERGPERESDQEVPGKAKGGATPWELPAARALIDWAFTEEHLALRRLALGKAPR